MKFCDDNLARFVQSKAVIQTILSIIAHSSPSGVSMVLADVRKRASSWDYGTYHIGDQRRLRQDRAFAVRTHDVWK